MSIEDTMKSLEEYRRYTEGLEEYRRYTEEFRGV